MALKNGIRSRRPKRICNVLNNGDSKSDEMNFSSDSECCVPVRKNKVRDGFSTKRLLKESEFFKVDSDHIYTSVRSPESPFNSAKKRKMSEETVKQKCISKNAVMAKLNRERKKKYVSSLESENKALLTENNEMTRKIENQNKTILAMRREILYLKGLLANSKELGQILKNLNEATGLPVTSSMILTADTEIRNKILENSSSQKPDDKILGEYQPRLRSITSGNNFPILDKDLNLGSCSDKSFSDMTDFENYPFDFEKDTYDLSTQALSNDSFFNFDSQNLDLECNEFVSHPDLSRNLDQNVGICLHVNQKRVSVEICSICHSKASSLKELPDNLD